MSYAVDNLCQTVDDLATIQAEISILELREKELKRELVDSMQREVQGTLHKAVVVFSPESRFCDYKAVVSHLGVSQSILDRFMKTKSSFSKVTLYGR